MNKERGYFQSSDMTSREKMKIVTSVSNVSVAYVKMRAIDCLDTLKPKFNNWFFLNVQWAVFKTLEREITFKKVIELYDYFKLDPETQCLDDLAYEIAKVIMIDLGERKN